MREFESTFHVKPRTSPPSEDAESVPPGFFAADQSRRSGRQIRSIRPLQLQPVSLTLADLEPPRGHGSDAEAGCCVPLGLHSPGMYPPEVRIPGTGCAVGEAARMMVSLTTGVVVRLVR